MCHVKWKFCIEVEHKDKTLVPKLDGFHKHNGRRKYKWPRLGQKEGELYISFNSQHVKNENIYNITKHDIIIDQVILLLTNF
jgi:hypothetical protein